MGGWIGHIARILRDASRRFLRIAWRLVRSLWILALAIAAGLAAAAAAAFFHIDRLPFFANLQGVVVDAVTGAFASTVTVYVIALTVQITEISAATRAAARDGIVDGVLGELGIPKLARVVEREMTKLPYLLNQRGARHFPADIQLKFKTELAKHRDRKFNQVALSFVTGQHYEPGYLRDAMSDLQATFKAAFRHVIVLSADRAQIIAAAELEDSEVSSLASNDMVQAFLTAVEKNIDWPNSRNAFGFTTEPFPVGDTPRELFHRFADKRASKALLHFGDEQGIVGMIELSKLVKLSLNAQEGRWR